LKYKLSNRLIEKSWFEDVLHSTLDLYNADEDTSNSPLIEFQRNWQHGGGMHASCFGKNGSIYEECIHKHQEDFFQLYEDIKTKDITDQRCCASLMMTANCTYMMVIID